MCLMKGYEASYDQSDSIYVEPWGGFSGSEWNYIPKGPIKEIHIAHGVVIDSIMFRTADSEQGSVDSPKFGGNGGSTKLKAGHNLK